MGQADRPGPGRPSPVVERPSPLTGLAHGGIALAAAAVFLIQELSDGGLNNLSGQALMFGIIAAVAVLGAGIFGLFAWRTTVFVVDDDGFRVERTFVWRSSSRLDYTKVQSVEIAQPLVARLLGLAKVHIDVGGTGGVDLAFLTRARAEALREHLLDRMASARAAAHPSVAVPDAHAVGPATPAVPGALPPPGAPEALVHAVPAGTLLLGTLVSTQALAASLVALTLLSTSIWSGTSITTIGAVVAFGGWAWANIGRNWGFRMTKRGDTLRVSRGLGSTTAQGLRPDRIQGVAIHQDLLQRVTGLYRVTVTVLGYAESGDENNGAANSVVLPFGRWADVLTVLGAIWPALDLGRIQPVPQPSRARWLTPFAFAQHTWGIGDDVVVAHHGLVERTLSIVPHRRMQSLSVHQGPLQRRLRLASIAVHTTDGPVTLRLYHLDDAVARRVFEEQLERGRAARAASA